MATVQAASLATERSPDLLAARFRELLDTVRANRPNDDVDIIRRAWDFCLEHHKGQLRASGEPFVLHPLEVALVLAEMKLDSTAIAAGLLHDAVEDTPVTAADIAAKFGEQVAHIVEASPRSTRFSSPIAKTARRKMFAKCSWLWSATCA